MAASIIATPAFADETGRTNKHEAAGLGSGLAIGAAIGGPVGAILGAALGAKFGDKYHEERTARLESESDYAVAQGDIAELGTQLRTREQRIAQMQQQMREEERSYHAAVQQALNAEIFFRTGESELSDEAAQRIGRIAQLVASLDGFVVRLEGHADNRGDEEYNEQLSAARAVAVRDALVSAGFPSTRIAVTAEGERASLAAEGDLDGLAMERRVAIELISGDSDPRVAARP
jgi:outer membrane protein OmpA-like peptidoglycan-associated protein